MITAYIKFFGFRRFLHVPNSVVSGLAWLWVVLRGYVWFCMVLCGFARFCMVTLGYMLFREVLHGLIGFVWFHVFCFMYFVWYVGLILVSCYIWGNILFKWHLKFFSLYKYPEIIFKLRLLMRCSFYIVFYMIDYFILVVLYPFGSIHTYIERKCDTIHILYIIYFLIFCTHLWSTCQKSSDFFLMIWVAIGPFIPK